MSSDTIYKRYSASCLQCHSEVSMSNFNRHTDSKQCKTGGKAVFGNRSIRNSLTCIYCNKLHITINSLAQHEIRCNLNQNRIAVHEGNRNPSIPSTQCEFCEKLYTTKVALGNHEARCKYNPNRKLQVPSEEGKLLGQQKHLVWATAHYANPANRAKVSNRMKQAVNDHPESYTGGNRGRTKQIIYNGVKFQGQWELDFYIWCEKADIQVNRSNDWFNYTWNGNRKYNPDFYLPALDLYVEIKGYETDRDHAKWNQFPRSLMVVKQSEISIIRSGEFTVELLLTCKWIKESIPS